MSIESSSILRIPGGGPNRNPVQDVGSDINLRADPVYYTWQNEAPDPWKAQARCADLPGADIDRLFFPDNGTATYEVRAFCAPCPVISNCQQYGQRMVAAHGEEGVGIYGGFHGGYAPTPRAYNPARRQNLPNSSSGENNSRAVLTAETVYEIRRRFDAGELFDVIAEAAGTTRQNVAMIGRRKRWASLPEQPGEADAAA